ncbi:hypothetical protein ACQZ5G_11370 [Agrobacterium sp. 22-214-1]
MKPISNISAQAIEKALARLAGSPETGKLSAARLAAEAGVSRATLYRAPELLRRLRELNAGREAPLTRTDRVRELEAAVAQMKGHESDELRSLRAANRNMAQHIQALSLLVRDLNRRIGQLQAEASPSGSPRVVPLAGRDKPP